jgi:hypothetical protein
MPNRRFLRIKSMETNKGKVTSLVEHSGSGGASPSDALPNRCPQQRRPRPVKERKEGRFRRKASSAFFLGCVIVLHKGQNLFSEVNDIQGIYIVDLSCNC